MSGLVVKSALPVRGVLQSLMSGVASVIATFAAAGSASQALEVGRQPAEADLQKLGMEGARFKRYY